MTQTKERLLDRLMAVAQEIPEEKLQEVVDFTEYLKSRYMAEYSERGSAEAILQALERVGPLRFEPGELDTLLTDIEQMRKLDLAEDDRLSV